MISSQRLNLIRYVQDCKKPDSVAYKSDGTTVPLKSAPQNKLKFVAGLWRVQNKMSEPIVNVRGVDFVIREKLPVSEKNLFEYYKANMVGENCYGKYIMTETPSYIVAKYETRDGTFWSYGNTIEQARAFLGIKLYDTYSDLIHRTVGVQKTK